MREGFQLRVLAPGLLVRVQVGQVPRVLEDLLSAGQLAVGGFPKAHDEAVVVREVGDQAGAVRQPVGVGEGRTTLEVHQEKSELVRRMVDDQRRQQGSEHLGLARTGGTDHEAVGSHTAEGRLLEVQQNHVALRSHSDGNPEVVTGAPRLPRPAGVQLGDIGHPEDLG